MSRTDQCVEATVRVAEPAVQAGTGIVGWDLCFVEGGSVWLTSEHCAETPRPGERIRLGGRGFGYRVEWIEIGGRRYR
jgi:hypothetical protein